MRRLVAFGSVADGSTDEACVFDYECRSRRRDGSASAPPPLSRCAAKAHGHFRDFWLRIVRGDTGSGGAHGTARAASSTAFIPRPANTLRPAPGDRWSRGI